jgi:hypothetical protein
MDMWTRVSARPALRLDLQLVRGGYLVCKVPTVAPGPTSGEATNPRVGLTSFSRTAFLNFVPCVLNR